jgi:hypothetical protein
MFHIRTVAAVTAAMVLAAPMRLPAQSVVIEPGGVKVTGKGGATRVQTGGVGSASATKGKTLTINGTGINKTYHVNGQNILIGGAGNDIILEGWCRSLRVSGTGNTVTADNVASITLSGVRNRVSYAGGLNGKATVIQRSGINNQATPR